MDRATRVYKVYVTTTEIVKVCEMSSTVFDSRNGVPTVVVDSSLSARNVLYVDEPGYMVVYRDGYESWLPRHIFEMTHREIDPQEIGWVASAQ